MDLSTFAILIAGALSGGFVSGLTGFGLALISLGFWLYIFPPTIAVPLVLICSAASQLSTLRTVWRYIDFKLVTPFLIGGLAGVVPGSLLVAYADPWGFKLFVGLLLVVFPPALFFSRPMAVTFGGAWMDGVVGWVGGVMGGFAGLSGPPPILWASVRGWDKHQRRGVFQAFNSTVLIAALVLQTAHGLVTRDVLHAALFALPGILLGAWLGAKTFHALNDRSFRNIVLALLFLSGLSLVWSSIAVR
jgi:uncharacterized membrane protein YfcA